LVQGGGGRGASTDGYLPKIPIDPWGNEYVYFSDGRNFVIKSYGPDGSDGGNDNNSDITSDD
jgi:general secretion pathway protein G